MKIGITIAAAAIALGLAAGWWFALTHRSQVRRGPVLLLAGITFGAFNVLIAVRGIGWTPTVIVSAALISLAVPLCLWEMWREMRRIQAARKLPQ